MIDKFKNSSIGQILIAAFVVGSIVAGIVIWFYESIRIPTLTSQLTFQENRVKSLEDAAAKEKTKELSATKMERLKFEPPKTVVTNPSNGVSISFEEAVLSVADKEDAAFLAIDKYVSDLRLVSYHMFIQESGEVQSKIIKSQNVEGMVKLLPGIIEKSNSCNAFVLKLESLRVHVTKRILEHYRQKLKNFEHHASVAFFSDIRQQTQILAELGELVKKLKSIENHENWNTNATKSIDEFISTNNGLAEQSRKTGIPIE